MLLEPADKEKEGDSITLYELKGSWALVADMISDPTVDPEVIHDTLESIEGQIEEKADGYAKVIREAEAQRDGIKAEIERLTARKQAIESNVRRMKDSLEDAMRVTGKTKFKTTLFSFGIQKNPPAVVMDEPHIENIPDKYLIQQEPKIDKAKIKEDLKAGIDIGIAHLEQSESLRIR